VAWAAHDLGLLALDRGDPAEAERLLREALQLFQRADYHWAIAVCACALATALVAGGTSGTLDEAGGLLEQALRLHDDVGDRRGIAQCLDALAEIAIARGAPAAAARLAGAAQAQRDAAATPPTDAERSRADAAEARLSTALGTAQLGHERQAGRTMPREAVRELAARIAVPGGAERARVVELTTRQREVATLVAAGHTNRQIGRELGISEKTAEIHVHNIMRRLDASSRAAVAAWVATSGLEPVP
jgi:non-specific serine/threonine protein kinase